MTKISSRILHSLIVNINIIRSFVYSSRVNWENSPFLREPRGTNRQVLFGPCSDVGIKSYAKAKHMARTEAEVSFADSRIHDGGIGITEKLWRENER
jgi:hypothetical protein